MILSAHSHKRLSGRRKVLYGSHETKSGPSSNAGFYAFATHCDTTHDKEDRRAQLRCKCDFLVLLQRFDENREVVDERKEELKEFRLSQTYLNH